MQLHPDSAKCKGGKEKLRSSKGKDNCSYQSRCGNIRARNESVASEEATTMKQTVVLQTEQSSVISN